MRREHREEILESVADRHQHDNEQASLCQILLMLEALITSHEDLEASCPSPLKQLAVLAERSLEAARAHVNALKSSGGPQKPPSRGSGNGSVSRPDGAL